MLKICLMLQLDSSFFSSKFFFRNLFKIERDERKRSLLLYPVQYVSYRLFRGSYCLSPLEAKHRYQAPSPNMVA